MTCTESFFDLDECAECGCQLPVGCGGVFRGGDACVLSAVDVAQHETNLAIADALLEGDDFLSALLRLQA
jgi:hypothetical protein